MDIPYLALSKQAVLVAFSVVFVLLSLVVWTSDTNKHSSLPLEESDTHHG